MALRCQPDVTSLDFSDSTVAIRVCSRLPFRSRGRLPITRPGDRSGDEAMTRELETTGPPFRGAPLAPVPVSPTPSITVRDQDGELLLEVRSADARIQAGV